MKKSKWTFHINQQMEKEFQIWASWFRDTYKKEPSRSDFIKTSLEIFNEAQPFLGRKARSKKLCIKKDR